MQCTVSAITLQMNIRICEIPRSLTLTLESRHLTVREDTHTSRGYERPIFPEEKFGKFHKSSFNYHPEQQGRMMQHCCVRVICLLEFHMRSKKSNEKKAPKNSLYTHLICFFISTTTMRKTCYSMKRFITLCSFVS